jgi:TRAP-type C4-dicarboxylate transport system permease small subunit
VTVVRRFVALLRALNEGLIATATIVTGVLVLAMVAAVTANVVARYVFDSSLPWSGEFSTLALLWVVLLAAAVAYRQGMFPTFTGLRDRLPERLRTPAQRLIYAVNAATAGFLVVVGLQFCDASRYQSSPVLDLNLALVYLAVPIGALLILLTSVEYLLGAPPVREGMEIG